MKKLLYFTAQYCGPCKTLAPIMNSLVQEGYNVQKLDVGVQTDLTAKYGVRSVPTVILVNEIGTEITRLVGLQPKESYINLLK